MLDRYPARFTQACEALVFAQKVDNLPLSRLGMIHMVAQGIAGRLAVLKYLEW